MSVLWKGGNGLVYFLESRQIGILLIGYVFFIRTIETYYVRKNSLHSSCCFIQLILEERDLYG